MRLGLPLESDKYIVSSTAGTFTMSRESSGMDQAAWVERKMKSKLWLILGVLACAISSLYMARILLPWEFYNNVVHGHLKAQMGDLYPRWVGTRELLLNGRNPYGPEVSHEIQIGFYGHAVIQDYADRKSELLDEQRFAYPVYVVFLMAPTAYIEFSQLQRWAPFVLGVLTAISVLLWLDVLHWRPPRVLIAGIILLVMGSPPVVQGLRLRQLGLAVAFLLALAAWCMVRNHLITAGVLLAVSTIKPQMVVLPLAWFFLWSLGAWPKRWPLFASFAGTLAALIGLGELVLPRWPYYFIEGLMAYRKYFPTTSIVCLGLGNVVGGVVSAIAIIALLAFAWQNHQAEASSPAFAQVLAAFCIAATLLMPLSTPFNQVLLLLPVLATLRAWSSQPRVLRGIFSVILAWPWCCELVLLLLPPKLDSTQLTPVLPSVLILLTPLVLLLLCVSDWRRNGRLQLPAADSPASVS